VDRTGRSTVIDFTGPQQVLEDPEPLVTGRRARHGNRLDVAADEAGPARRAAARRLEAADTDDPARAPRSRRRVSWRKGSDVDEELWPAEAFGGVSDEQFWDDLAADKPLATTARTAQPDTGRRQRPRQGPGTHPQPRLGPDDRTAVHPVQATGQLPSASTLATQPYQAARQPAPAVTQPVSAPHRPAEPRGRSRAGLPVDDDPLTSPAYSLRPKGRVDGRSYPSSHPPSHSGNGLGRPDPPRADSPRLGPPRSGDAYAGTGPYSSPAAHPYSQQPYGEPAQSMSTPPYGERYGYGNPAGSQVPAGDSRRANGGWSPGPAGGPGDGDGKWDPRPAYPPVSNHRGPYDPQGHDRRLTNAR
jgi:hypothetical protein